MRIYQVRSAASWWLVEVRHGQTSSEVCKGLRSALVPTVAETEIEPLQTERPRLYR